MTFAGVLGLLRVFFQHNTISTVLIKPQRVLCMHLSSKSCRNCRPCGKVTSSSPDSTPIIVFCSSVTPEIRAT